MGNGVGTSKPELHSAPSLPAVCSLKLETLLSSCWTYLQFYQPAENCLLIREGPLSSGQDALFLWPALLDSHRSSCFHSELFRLSSPSISHDVLYLIPLIPAPHLFPLHLLVLHLPHIYGNYPKVMSQPGISGFVSLEKTESETDIRVRKCLFYLPTRCPCDII